MQRTDLPQLGQQVLVQMSSLKKAETLIRGVQVQKPCVAETDTVGAPTRVLIRSKITGLLQG